MSLLHDAIRALLGCQSTNLVSAPCPDFKNNCIFLSSQDWSKKYDVADQHVLSVKYYMYIPCLANSPENMYS